MAAERIANVHYVVTLYVGLEIFESLLAIIIYNLHLTLIMMTRYTSLVPNTEKLGVAWGRGVQH